MYTTVSATKLEFELKSRLGFSQHFGRTTRPQARFNLVSNSGEEEFARRQALPHSWTQAFSWDMEADTALILLLLQPEDFKPGSFSHICDQAVDVESAPASWKRCVAGCVEGSLHHGFCFCILPPEVPSPQSPKWWTTRGWGHGMLVNWDRCVSSWCPASWRHPEASFILKLFRGGGSSGVGQGNV